MIDRRALVAAGLCSIAAPALAAPDRPTISRIVVTAGRIFLPVTIAGSGPFPFILDTGAVVSAIDPKLAERLKLSKIGHRRMNGVGGVADFDFYEAKDVVFGGGVHQSSAVFGGFSMQGSAGLLAAGLFTTHDSDIDFDASEWRVHPRGRPSRDGWTRLDAHIRQDQRNGSDKIIVEAELDGQRLRLMLDTGAPHEVLLFPPAARRSGLWSDDKPFAPERLRGIGGAVERLGRVVRGKHLVVGGFDFDAPLIRIYDPKEYAARENIDGLVGLAVIERLNLSTEVKRASVWAQRSRRPKPPEIYGASGAWLDRLDGGRARIAVLSPGSPAAAAGLKVGDVLTGIEDWSRFIRRFAGPAGTTVDVDVETAAGPVARTVALAPYL